MTLMRDRRPVSACASSTLSCGASVIIGIAARGKSGPIGDLHSAITGITLALVILHIIGVIVASITHRENLVAAMFSGKKREN